MHPIVGRMWQLELRLDWWNPSPLPFGTAHIVLQAFCSGRGGPDTLVGTGIGV